MIQPSNRKMSTCIYMAAISIIDNLMKSLALNYCLVTVAKIHELGQWECKINSYLTHFSIQSSTYQVLAMTIDKYIAIKWPHKAAVHSASKRVRAILFSVNVGALSYSVPDIFAASVVGGECLSYSVFWHNHKSLFFDNFCYKWDHTFHNVDLHEICHCSNY